MSINVRKTDWVCSNCNYLIFGSKNKCHKCNKPKPIVNNLKNIENYKSQNRIWESVIKEKAMVHEHKMETDPEYNRFYTILYSDICKHDIIRSSCFKCD